MMPKRAPRRSFLSQSRSVGLSLRVTGPDGKWINEAQIAFDNPALPQLKTDSSGRASVVGALRDQVRGSVSAPGHASKEFFFGCTEFFGHEEMVKLNKR